MKKIPKTLLSAVRKKFGDHSAAVFAEGGYSSVEAVLPTGLVVLDRWVIGIGGVPYGHITEIWGKEASGKTTILLSMIAQCQRENGFVFLRDAEQKIQHGWAAQHGVDLDGVFLQTEGTVEDFVDMSTYLMEKVPTGPFLVALDSVAFLASREELDKEGEAAMGANARAWSSKIKVFAENLAKRQAAWVFLNQPRNMISNYGSFPTTPGGNALKAAPLLRLKVQPGEKFTDPKRGDGQIVKVTANKNQLAPPYRSCEMRLNFGGSWDEPWAIVNHAKSVGCLEKKKDRRQWAEALENLGWAEAIPQVAASLGGVEVPEEAQVPTPKEASDG